MYIQKIFLEYETNDRAPVGFLNRGVSVSQSVPVPYKKMEMYKGSDLNLGL
jgi:hypothetical protein